MTDLLEKARQGRLNALNAMAPANARIQSPRRHEKITFISSRARQQANGTLI